MCQARVCVRAFYSLMCMYGYVLSTRVIECMYSMTVCASVCVCERNYSLY